MARLQHVNGSTVNVPDEKVEALLSRGFFNQESQKAPAAKKTAARKSSK